MSSTSPIEALAKSMEAAAAELERLAIARRLLERLVRSKERDTPNPEAWTQAFALVHAWREADGDPVPSAPTFVRCPECSKLLANSCASLEVDGVRGSHAPIAFDCGPEHVLDYDAYVVVIGEDSKPIVQKGDRTITEHAPVFGEGSDDADVSD